MERDATIREHLVARREVIAQRWYHELLATGFPGRTAQVVRQEIETLTQQAIELLLAASLDRAAAQGLGAALIGLGFHEAAALGQTQQLLGDELVRDLRPEQLAALQPRLTALLGALAVGFLEHRDAWSLTKQEEVRRALLSAEQEAAAARCLAEDRLRLVVKHAPILLFAFDPSGQITLAEGQGLERLGYQPGELVGHSAWEGVTAISQLPDTLRRALAGESFGVRTCVRGTVFETYYNPRLEQGQVVEVIGVATDITARVRAEAVVHCIEIGLSPTEQRILPLLARSDLTTYRQIGDLLHLEAETVRSHSKAIAAKLGVAADRRTLVAAALERGVLPPG